MGWLALHALCEDWVKSNPQIGVVMKDHSTHGNGFQEVIYQRALAIEMGKNGASFQREPGITISLIEMV
jgi:GxxExxY protein